ncbi:MAG TPA: o-succinylbenzoate synthase [Longimicrobiales bacterium]|nr:o-succinylbenzoate synthase [Longimicrobiales bacterium]
MRIERIVVREVGLELREPFRISSGLTRQRRILLVHIEGDGVDGVGECVAGEAPNYSYETVETARWALESHLGPAVLGAEVEGPGEIQVLLEGAAKGHRMAKAAIEMAVWDADARRRGVSLASHLGGTRASVPAGVSIGIQESMEGLLERIGGFLAEGYRRIKLKIEPGRDFAVLDGVRARYPEIPLTVDANAAYPVESLARVAELDRYGLMLVEQPFGEDEVLAHAALQARLETPVCLDETVTSPARCREALALAACRVVNIKPGRLGGHGASLAVHDLCAAAGVPVWCGGMLESGIGRAHNVALASLPNMRLPNDTSASARYWARDVVAPPFELDGEGMVRVPTGPGIGVELDEDYLAALEVGRVELY